MARPFSSRQVPVLVVSLLSLLALSCAVRAYDPATTGSGNPSPEAAQAAAAAANALEQAQAQAQAQARDQAQAQALAEEHAQAQAQAQAAPKGHSILSFINPLHYFNPFTAFKRKKPSNAAGTAAAAPAMAPAPSAPGPGSGDPAAMFRGTGGPLYTTPPYVLSTGYPATSPLAPSAATAPTAIEAAPVAAPVEAPVEAPVAAKVMPRVTRPKAHGNGQANAATAGDGTGAGVLGGLSTDLTACQACPSFPQGVSGGLCKFSCSGACCVSTWQVTIGSSAVRDVGSCSFGCKAANPKVLASAVSLVGVLIGALLVVL